MKIKYVIGCLILLLFVSCNKEKHFSNKLMKGEIWQVKDITVDGASISPYGNWLVTSDVNIYDSVPEVSWEGNDEDAVFEWQFQNKGKNFRLQYVQLCEEINGADLDSLDYWAYYLTGNYTVEKHGRNQMVFLSDSTLKYTGQTVEIAIERQ